MSQQLLSPLTQVMQTPSLVISHLHMPIVRLQQQTMAPFIMQQQLHLEPAIMEQRFCSMEQAILSSQLQVIFMPPVHFSIFMVQRGIIKPFMAGVGAGMPAPMPGIIMPEDIIGFIVAVAMVKLLLRWIRWSPGPLGCWTIGGLRSWDNHRLTTIPRLAITT